MLVQVQAKGLPRAAALRRRAVAKMQAALGRFSHVVAEVNVRLADINGPRGGVDKLCRIVVRMQRSSLVVIQELGADMAPVIDRAADRVHRSVSRQLGQLPRVERSGMRARAPAAALAWAWFK